MTVKYMQSSKLGYGLKNGHKYEVKFSKPHGLYCYVAHFIYDDTEKEEMDKTFTFASEISLKRLFEFDKLEMD